MSDGTAATHDISDGHGAAPANSPAGTVTPAAVQVLPVILAGGSGTRLWPLSRGDYPKQLLRLEGDLTLLQRTATRLGARDDLGPGFEVAAPLVVAGEDLRFLIADQMQSVAAPGFEVMLEPTPRNTAPAIAAAALRALAGDADPVLVVMPADHVLRDTGAFRVAVATAVRLSAAEPVIATFGIVPSRPETGFGYIQRGAPIASHAGAFRLQRFLEKPDEATAQALVADGEHYWNSGIFVARASVLARAIATHAPAMNRPVQAAVAGGVPDAAFFRLDATAFAECPSDSFDYAVMEHLRDGDGAVGAAVVSLDAGWSDVGSWEALVELVDPDDGGNVTQGDVVTVEATGNVLVSSSRLVAALGVDDLVVVETPDAVFVTRKDMSQRVKEMVAELSARQREEARSHRKVYRPWGAYESIDSGERYQVKRLTVNPGSVLSLQMHHHRAEHWVVVRGTAKVTKGEEEFLLTENESVYLPLGVTHRLENPGKVPLEVIEVQSGSYLGEDDIVRFQDVYKRV